MTIDQDHGPKDHEAEQPNPKDLFENSEDILREMFPAKYVAMSTEEVVAAHGNRAVVELDVRRLKLRKFHIGYVSRRPDNRRDIPSAL